MRVLGYTWAGVRTADLKSAARFFADTLELRLTQQSDELIQFELPSGQLFEIFGSKSRYYRLQASLVLAFQVENVRDARSELESRGVEFVTDTSNPTVPKPGRTSAVPMITSTNSGKPLAASRHFQPFNSG